MNFELVFIVEGNMLGTIALIKTVKGYTDL